MSDKDLLSLYSGRILALTTEIPHLGRLPDPDGSGEKRSPQCGSSVKVELTMHDGRVLEFAQEVRACALGQAAAAIVGKAVIGRSAEELQAGLDGLNAMLEGAPPPEGPFAEFEVLTPARDFKNRHASIRLALEATIAAVEKAEQTSP